MYHHVVYLRHNGRSSFDFTCKVNAFLCATMSTATSQHPVPSQPLGVRSPPAFEFPKRKRWADLLLTELVDDVAFVLSPSYKIMYCGTAVTELLGWKDIGLSDLDFLDLVSRTYDLIVVHMYQNSSVFQRWTRSGFAMPSRTRYRMGLNLT